MTELEDMVEGLKIWFPNPSHGMEKEEVPKLDTSLQPSTIKQHHKGHH
jgi:hypothetical protein